MQHRCFLDWCFCNILMSCITILPFSLQFPEKFPHWNLPQNRAHNIALATLTSLPISPQHQRWVLATLDSYPPCVNGCFTLLGLGSHGLELCPFQWKLTHRPWSWWKLSPVWSPCLLSKSLLSCPFLDFCGGSYHSLSQCLVSLKSGVTYNSLFHPPKR